MEQKCLVLRKDIFEIRAFGIDPKLGHATRTVKAAGDKTGPLAFAHIAQIDDHNVRVIHHFDGVLRADLFDAGAGAGDQSRGGCGELLHSFTLR